MGRKPKNEDAGSPETTTQVIPEKRLRALLKDARATKSNIAEISGAHGDAVKTAIDKHHLHRKAFSIAKQLDGMETERLNVCLAHLDYYLDAGGIRERAGQVQTLPYDGDEEVEETATEETAEDFAEAAE